MKSNVKNIELVKYEDLFKNEETPLPDRPIIVRQYTDEEADILVADYNITREDLLPSEKARAYKLKLGAMKRQGEQRDLASDQLVLSLSDNAQTNCLQNR